MEPTRCSVCKYWMKHPDAHTWGTCELQATQVRPLGGVPAPDGIALSPVFTRNIYVCAAFIRRKRKDPDGEVAQ